MLVSTSSLLCRRVTISRSRLLSPLKAAFFLVSIVAQTTTSRAFSYTMNFITERDAYGTITMTPKNEAEQSALLVICHGLGDTADGFDDVAEVSSIILIWFELKEIFIINVSLFCVFTTTIKALGSQIALHENYFAHCTNPTSDHEHGNGHAILVRYQGIGCQIQRKMRWH